MGANGPRETEGEHEGLPPIHWTLAGKAKPDDAGHREEAHQEIVKLYWRPVYWYFRKKTKKGHEAAKELAQRFLADELVSEGTLLQEAARQESTTFQALLCKALRHYGMDQHQKDNAQKRKPDSPVVLLEQSAAEPPALPAQVLDPEEAATYALAVEFLWMVILDAKKELERKGMNVHWETFQAVVLDPLLAGKVPLPRAEIGGQLGIDGESKDSNVVAVAGRFFRAQVRKHAILLASSGRGADQAARELASLLDRRAR